MQNNKQNVLKIILYVIIGAAFITSLYFSYLYLKKYGNFSKPTPPAEIAQIINAERKGYFGEAVEINADKIKIKTLIDNQQIEIYLDVKTKYTQNVIGKNERTDIKPEDIKKGSQINIVAYLDAKDGKWIAENVEIIAQE